MQSRILLYSSEARARLKKGVDALANMVKVTLGPKGRNVILDRKFGGPVVTKDGVTVAKEIYLEDVVENMGAQLVREVASKTADVAGDGTTTATVLAQAIIQEGFKAVTSGANPMDLKRGIDLAVKAVVAELGRISRPVEGKEEIASVGSISANNDPEIGELIANAMEQVGKEGVITVEDAKGIETSLEMVDGMQFDRGYLSAYFITDIERMQVELADTYILLSEDRLADMTALLPLLEKVVKEGNAILLIAEDFEQNVLKTLVVNKMNNVVRTCAVKAPGFGDRRKDILQDIALVTDARVLSSETGVTLATFTLKDFGFAEKVIITKDTTTIVGGAGNKELIRARAEQIKTQIDQSTSDYDKQKFQERLAKLVGGVGVLRVGAATETEMKEKKMRIEDAMHATRAAVEEGIVPGGGVVYIRARSVLKDMMGANEDQTIGIDIIYKALQRPLFDIVENAAQSGAVILSKIDETFALDPTAIDYGYNALTDVYERLIVAGVIDPTKVARAALENAASVAGLFLTTEGVVAESPEEKEAQEKLMNREPMY